MASVPAWTPGPWHVSNGELLRVNTRDSITVAGVHRIGRYTGGEPNPYMVLANANLIAAAPDLYRLLVLAVAVIEGGPTVWMGADEAYKTLARARGERP